MKIELEFDRNEAQIALAYIWAEMARQRQPETGNLQAAGVLEYVHGAIEKVAIKEENNAKNEKLRAAHNQLENALDEVRELMARNVADESFYSTCDSAQARAGEIQDMLCELLQPHG